MSFHKSTTKNKQITWLTETLGTMPGENRTSGCYWVVSTRRTIIKLAAVTFLSAAMAGCSGTTIRCGSDGQSTYVDLVNIPDNLPNQIKSYAQLCNFKETSNAT